MFALEEALILTCQGSRVIFFHAKRKKNSIAKLNDRWFCYFTAAIFLPSEQHKHGASIQSSINFGDTLTHFCENALREKQQRPDSWQGCLCSNHLSYPRFLTLFSEWLGFLVLITCLVKIKRTYNYLTVAKYNILNKNYSK